MTRPLRRLRIAYAIQNVGGIDFDQDVGDTVPVKQTLSGLRRAGHDVCCLKLDGRAVLGIADISRPKIAQRLPVGMTDTRSFGYLERGVRRLQRVTGLPYFAFFDTLRFYEACRRQLVHYDLCHEHNGLFSIGAALACSKLRLPYILTVSAEPLFERKLVGRPLHGIHGWVAKWEAQLTYRAARRIVTVSEPAKRDLVKYWHLDADKIIVMPNGVDVEEFKPLLTAHRWSSEHEQQRSAVVTFVGTFQIWHGLDVLVDSFARVVAEIPNARLLLVGDGPARPQIEQKISEYRIKRAVTITGLVPRTEVPKILAATDIAVIPYPKLPKELWFSPLKLYEYMAAGKAIVASEAGQIADVLTNDHTGLLVEAGNVDAFTDAIVALLKNPALRLRLGENARRQAIARHSWDEYIRRLEEIYQSVL